MDAYFGRFQELLDQLYDGVYFVDNQRRITYWNHAAEAITGFSVADVLGRSCADNILTHIDSDGHSLCRGSCPLAQTLVDGQSREAEVYLHHRRGHRVPVAIRVSAIRDAAGQIVGAAELFNDVSSSIAIRERFRELEKLAYVDALTELANRRYVAKEIQQRIEELKRYDWKSGLIFADIDHFKRINDDHGHNVGDQVLKAVARTLAINVRSFDLFGRWGGEEFLGIIRNIDESALLFLADRLRMLVANTQVAAASSLLSVTVSVGVTIMTLDDDLEKAVQRADRLMYRSKCEGRNRTTLG
ncbi:MAG: sensor domain-containing diguanylate cyclase [Syntrophobacteraceae bacterium CG2_30_61_12]|nr:MAG: sensor domain-containing diguanylate cyclase [Syntrophobacteraceae bacterium CG2_30_61_12]PIU32834.1 MAG: sensor domain-containing diguanylate cyclase [Syntrophobacteraceae bacterium CG07_land_8_20_14_0_80_61_8]